MSDPINSYSREQKVALYRRLRTSAPDIAAVIDEVAEVFPGSKVTFVEIDGEQFGQRDSVGFTVGIDAIRPRLMQEPAPAKKKGRR